MGFEEFNAEENPLTGEGTRAILSIFVALLKHDERQARVMLTSSVVTCLAMLTPEQRFSVVRALFDLLKDIGVESFEDGSDFVSFLAEKREERNNAKD